jgi:mono/diheme cytochrome c family protein
MTRLPFVCLWLSALAVGGCSGGPEVSRNLPEGDATRGRQAFVDLQCTGCHEVAGTPLPAPAIVPAVTLGGRMLLPPSRAQIAEDILLPSSHFARGYPASQITDAGKSKMPDYSQALTTQQVADLAAFLEVHYRRGLPSATK